ISIFLIVGLSADIITVDSASSVLPDVSTAVTYTVCSPLPISCSVSAYSISVSPSAFLSILISCPSSILYIIYSIPVSSLAVSLTLVSLLEISIDGFVMSIPSNIISFVYVTALPVSSSNIIVRILFSLGKTISLCTLVEFSGYVVISEFCQK